MKQKNPPFFFFFFFSSSKRNPLYIQISSESRVATQALNVSLKKEEEKKKEAAYYSLARGKNVE